jgi:hypothetical protein
MAYLILLSIGLVMGLLGGMLGIGGSVVMIPAMVFAFGENQHLYQGAAMICNFAVAASSAMAHKKADALVPAVLRWLIPAAIVGVLLGVAGSNLALFAGGKSYRLARLFGAFLVYVAGYEIYKLIRSATGSDQDGHEDAHIRPSGPWASLIGLVTGIAAGLLGIGAGTVATPLQQILLKLPMRRAMANSAAAIIGIAGVGAIYKNASLGASIHFDLFSSASPVVASLKIAALVVPTGFVGGYIGGHLMHRLPKNWVRAAFLVVVILGAYKLLTVPASPAAR